MSKKTDTAPASDAQDPAVVAAAAADAASTAVTLDEYCMRLSQTDRRVELIGAFHSLEKRHRHMKDTEAAFSARFTDFVNKPV